MTTTTSPYADLMPGTIARALAANRDEQAHLKAQAQDMEAELLRQIRETRGRTEILDPDFRIAIDTASPTYDHGLLVALREVLTEDEWDKVFTPAFTKTVDVPEKYNGSALNSIERLCGSDVARIIGQARIPGASRLVVERKG
jgi:hypothetical protein